MNTKWESGFGVETTKNLILIETLMTKVIYDTLIITRRTTENYKPNPTHNTIAKIEFCNTRREKIMVAI